ncbi:bone morphogenetic protein receptor type-1B-like protein [Anopheles sinensis]|uniref:Bone morphogenetic protein receptor type-1B-like protein n=1 Tax=Anopheles sinensis TaxID=74873 RepID=A0A084VKB2_ANOSI|nr:bone morphogenetic protein receptor type-1B-like protein [Anopheles sinensis]
MENDARYNLAAARVEGKKPKSSKKDTFAIRYDESRTPGSGLPELTERVLRERLWLSKCTGGKR